MHDEIPQLEEFVGVGKELLQWDTDFVQKVSDFALGVFEGGHPSWVARVVVFDEGIRDRA